MVGSYVDLGFVHDVADTKTDLSLFYKMSFLAIDEIWSPLHKCACQFYLLKAEQSFMHLVNPATFQRLEDAVMFSGLAFLFTRPCPAKHGLTVSTHLYQPGVLVEQNWTRNAVRKTHNGSKILDIIQGRDLGRSRSQVCFYNRSENPLWALFLLAQKYVFLVTFFSESFHVNRHSPSADISQFHARVSGMEQIIYAPRHSISLNDLWTFSGYLELLLHSPHQQCLVATTAQAHGKISLWLCTDYSLQKFLNTAIVQHMPPQVTQSMGVWRRVFDFIRVWVGIWITRNNVRNTEIK